MLIENNETVSVVMMMNAYIDIVTCLAQLNKFIYHPLHALVLNRVNQVVPEESG